VVLTPQGQIQDLKPGAQRFEVATSPYPLYSALHTALQLQNQWGNAQQRYHRIVSLSTHLWQQLNTHPRCTCLLTTPPQSGLVSFQWQGSSTLELVKTLEAQGILIRKLAFPDCVRAGVHYLTLEEEIEALLSALESLD
jgi:L-cysteine/cystine lyase